MLEVSDCVEKEQKESNVAPLGVINLPHCTNHETNQHMGPGALVSHFGGIEETKKRSIERVIQSSPMDLPIEKQRRSKEERRVTSTLHLDRHVSLLMHLRRLEGATRVWWKKQAETYVGIPILRTSLLFLAMLYNQTILPHLFPFDSFEFWNAHHGDMTIVLVFIQYVQYCTCILCLVPCRSYHRRSSPHEASTQINSTWIND